MPELNVTVRQTGPSASEGAARQHRVSVDRPVEKGGSDAGPMGGELFLLGLGGCFMSNLLAAIRARESAIRGVSVDVSAFSDGTPVRFTDFTLTVRADAADRAELEKLVLIAERSCIVANSLKPFFPVTVKLG